MYAVLLLLFGPSSCVQLFAIPCTATNQSPLSLEFSVRDSGVGVHFPSQEIFPHEEWNLYLVQADSPYGIGLLQWVDFIMEG